MSGDSPKWVVSVIIDTIRGLEQEVETGYPIQWIDEDTESLN